MVIPKMNKARAERVMGRVGYASCLCSPEGLSSFLRCMYIFVCMYVHIYVCIGMHTEVRGLPQVSDSIISPIHFLKQGSLSLELTD